MSDFKLDVPLPAKAAGPHTPERRAEARLNSNNAHAELAIISGVVSITATPALIADVSSSGMRVIAHMQTCRGQQVRIKIGKLMIFGEVRHCRPKGAQFVSGVRISDVVGGRRIRKTLTVEQIDALTFGCGLPAA